MFLDVSWTFLGVACQAVSTVLGFPLNPGSQLGQDTETRSRLPLCDG